MFTIKCFSEFRSFSAGGCGCHDSSGSDKRCDGNEDKNVSGQNLYTCDSAFKKHVLLSGLFLWSVLLFFFLPSIYPLKEGKGKKGQRCCVCRKNKHMYFQPYSLSVHNGLKNFPVVKTRVAG